MRQRKSLGFRTSLTLLFLQGGATTPQKGLFPLKAQKGIRLSSWVRLVALSLLLGFGLLTGTMLASRTAHAQALGSVTITDCTDDTQLQSAVSSASSGDTITFGCSGDIKLTKTLTIAANLTLDGSSQSVTLDGGNSVQVLSVNSGVTFTLNALTIAHGFSDSGSGGIENDSGTVSISNSTFANNSADEMGEGGGLFNGGTVSISNSTFANNSTDFLGGGLLNVGTVSISNSTFANNSAISSGGIDNASEFGTVSISGSIVANNNGGNCSGLVRDQGYNLESSTDCGFTASTSQQNTNPMLASGLANNGGPTQTLALLDGSPAINKIPSGSSCPSTDQRGIARPQGSACDIGAFEYRVPTLSLPATITVNATGPNGAPVTYTVTASEPDDSSATPTVSCSPASGSTFPIGTTTVNCTASDAATPPDTTTGSFQVVVQPTLTVSVPSVNATEGSAFSGVVATGTAYGTSNPLSAGINWGDGNSSTGSVTPNPDGSYSVSSSHTYAEEGPYALTVTVKDSGSLSATGNGSATVSDAALSLAHFVAGPLGNHAAGVAAVFTDADPAGQVSDYTATINWGDGTTATVKVIKNPLGKGFVLADLHKYASKGTYTLTLTVSDSGGSQLTKTVTITVK